MPVILLTNHYQNRPLDIVESALPEGFELVVLKESSQEELEKSVDNADYLLVSGRLKINKEVLSRASKVKMIQRTGVGLDSLDLNEIKKKGIPLYVNKGVNANSVAEHTIMLILAALRRLPEIDRNTKSGVWKKQLQGVHTYELYGRTVGIVGMGSIGQAVARRLSGFGVKIIYYDMKPIDSEMESLLNVTRCSMQEVLEQSDILTLHCPLTDETDGMICAETINKMKDGAIIINTARGKLINEPELKDALDSGKIMYAGVDVYSEEPPKNNCLLDAGNIITTPHVGGVTYDSFSRMMNDAMRNIKLFDEGKIEDIEEYKLQI